MSSLRTLYQANPTGKRIFLRVDFNVPIESGKILDDFRIRSGLDTIKYLLKKSPRLITIATHLGRPEGKFAKELIIAPIKNRFFDLLPEVKGEVKFFENLRFNAGEEENDDAFSQELARGQDIFINDAFGTLHRKHASVFGITKYLPSFAGLLVENELKAFNYLKSPQEPFVVIIGGAKLEEKMGMIDVISKVADIVLVGGKTALEIQKEKEKEKEWPKNMVLPIDGIEERGVIYDIGPKTIELFAMNLQGASTIFWNGNLGKSEDKRFIRGSEAIAHILAKSKAKTYIGGGDTVSLVNNLGLAEKMAFLSTGGGVSLMYLAGEELPGLKVLMG